MGLEAGVGWGWGIWMEVGLWALAHLFLVFPRSAEAAFLQPALLRILLVAHHRAADSIGSLKPRVLVQATFSFLFFFWLRVSSLDGQLST